MPHHFSILAARRDRIYYVNGLELDFLSENEPDFIPKEPTHTLADLIESFRDNAASEADQGWFEKDEPSRAIHRVIHRIIVHQGGAVVNGDSIWENTYPERGEEEGWIRRVQCGNHHHSFLEEVKDFSISEGSLEWEKAIQEMEERIALDERFKYYLGWESTYGFDLKLPIARNIKVWWANQASRPDNDTLQRPYW